jgi:hypothetical protein
VDPIINGHGEELRDKFAAAALVALLNHIQPSAFGAPRDKNSEGIEYDRVAAEAFRWADAMLRVRNQP